MPNPSKPVPEQNPPQPMTDPAVPPMRDPPGEPYRDPVQPPLNDPPPQPIRDPQPPGFQDPPDAAAERWLKRPPHGRFLSRARSRAPDGTTDQSSALRNRRAFAMTLTDDSAIAAAPIIGESNTPKIG